MVDSSSVPGKVQKLRGANAVMSPFFVATYRRPAYPLLVAVQPRNGGDTRQTSIATDPCPGAGTGIGVSYGDLGPF